MAQSSLHEFLEGVNPSFVKYADKLIENGLSEVEGLSVMQDEDFKYLDIPLFHWRQIVAKARKLNPDTETPEGGGARTESSSVAAQPEPAPAFQQPPIASAANDATPPAKKHKAAGWGADEVALWVRTLSNGQYEQYAVNFKNANMDGAQLISVAGVKDLADIVPDLGARYAIYQEVEDLQEGKVPSVQDMLAMDQRNEARPKGNSEIGVPGKQYIDNTEWGADDKSGGAGGRADKQNLFVKPKDQSNTRQRLLKFYEIYNPAKLNDEDAVDELLKRYQGKETQLFADLEQKYILSGPSATYKRKQLDTKKEGATDKILLNLSKFYHEGIRHVEQAFEFPEFHTPLLDEVDFLARPMVLLVGQYSTGKTSFIRFLVGRDFPGIRVGPEPTTDAFGAVMWGREERLIPGHTVPMDRSKPFRTLQGFGAGFLNKFSCAEVPAPILESITFVDTPGILSGEKQRLGRNYDFAKVVEWFAYRSDRILLLFDAHKLDISDEFKASIEMLKGHDDKIRCVLNKADAVSNQQLLRVYGALMWSLGKVFKTPEVLRVYVGSFWDEPYANEHNAELFDSEADDLLSDLRGLPRHSATRKINEFVKRTRQLKVHCLIVEHLRKQFGFFGKDKKQTKLLNNLRNEFRAIAKEHSLNLNDFPNPDKFRQLIQKFEIAKFPKFKDKWRGGIDRILEHEVPQLMRQLPSHSGRDPGDEKDGGGGAVANPFAQANDRGDANLDPSKQWAVNGTDKAKYDTKFYSLQLTSGKASGQQVMNVMLQSGLSTDVLRTIWDLSDIDQDGKMDDDEFALCMYLIDMIKGGIKLPPTLPVALVPPSKRHLVEYE